MVDQLWAAEKGRVGLPFGALVSFAAGQIDGITLPGSLSDPRQPETWWVPRVLLTHGLWPREEFPSSPKHVSFRSPTTTPCPRPHPTTFPKVEPSASQGSRR